MTKNANRGRGGDSSGTWLLPPRLPATLLSTMRDRSLPPARRLDAQVRVFDHVYRVVSVILGRGRPEVEDAAQEAFLAVFNASKDLLAKVEPDAEVAPWINTIAARKAIDHRRRARHRAYTPLEDVPSLPHDAASPDDAVGLTYFVGRLLESLTDEQREIVLLRYWGGHTDEDIAERLDACLGTVKTRLRRSLRVLLSQAKRMEAGSSWDFAIPWARDGTDPSGT